jgi:predicted nucleotidyltransferase
MDPDLENYRKHAIAVLKQNAAFIRDTARDVLRIPAREVYACGSVLERAFFREDSDIDVAVVVDGPELDTGLSETMSNKLQNEMVRYPFDDIGVVNTLVFVNKLDLQRGKSLKIAVEP